MNCGKNITSACPCPPDQDENEGSYCENCTNFEICDYCIACNKLICCDCGYLCYYCDEFYCIEECGDSYHNH